MAQIALPRHHATQSPSGSIGSPLYQRRQPANAGPVELLPNPHFSFPMRGPDSSSSEPTPTTSQPMSLQAYPTARRASMPHQRQKSVSALPAFSFNPAATTQPSTGPSPPHTPTALPATPEKPVQGGHRRRGSELIGGDVRPGGMSLMSSSPTKGDGVLPSPNATLRPGPPAGRRGHAHRRSGAISSHDLTSIMNPPAPIRAGSAPATPSESNAFTFGHSVNRSISQPSLRGNGAEDDSAARPPSRARVGFSDRVEYIRPLSTISSETEGSMSTFRGHSATNSLSSIVGGCNSSPQPSRMGRPSLSTVQDEGRPSTAGAILDNFMSSPLAGEPSDRKRPMSAVSPTSLVASGSTHASTKRRSFFRIESKRSDHSMRTLPASRSDPSLSRSMEASLPSPSVDGEDPVDEVEKSKPSTRKSSRKPRKVKSWANSIIPRKGKHSKKSKSKLSTSPAESIPDQDETDGSEDMDFEPNFDEDTTVTIVSPTESSTPLLKIDTDFASWQPRQLKRVDSDIISPIIDLDAALGPFNTPNGSSPRAQQRGFSAHRRAMHSASGLVVNHRRTESAPELVPFELRSSAIASASPMADVFEEEEPEDDSAVSPKEMQPASVAEESEETEEPKIQVVETDGKHEGTAIKWNFNDGLGIKRTEKNGETALEEPLSPRGAPHDISNSRSSPEAGLLVADESKEHQPVMNMALPLPQQSLLTPDTVTSSFASPDYRSSEISFETSRVGTAASSVTDYSIMPSPRFGEPGPELRISVDDVPSLTSSRSTMTSAMPNPYSLPSPRRPGDCSASFCSDPSDLETRRRKRSSIASLSRLINSSSHGEKSKLSIEQRPQSEHLELPKDKKKTKRLSKLMFWKPKDSSSSQAPIHSK
ncbi:hypothetical protein BDU57DRAFT_445222 [Ampelomyces quisqualis]|uniref:Cell wall proline rich protein n=1 Tax=Ampelomyces quisqualis TaxID=50730 RepID=A0A6A5QSG7_AMPQU|nr:hypothetical protein BDU57DRAFT_445222 [Ampelomyces quisqualis]